VRVRVECPEINCFTLMVQHICKCGQTSIAWVRGPDDLSRAVSALRAKGTTKNILIIVFQPQILYLIFLISDALWNSSLPCPRWGGLDAAAGFKITVQLPCHTKLWERLIVFYLSTLCFECNNELLLTHIWVIITHSYLGHYYSLISGSLLLTHIWVTITHSYLGHSMPNQHSH